MEQGQSSGTQNTIDALNTIIDSLMAEMTRLITPPTAGEEAPDCFISWVSDVDPNCKPDKVPIGPLHWKPSHWMENEKKKLLGLLLDDQPQHREKKLRHYLTEMERHECRALQFYKNRTFSWLTSLEFARMLLLDGYFLYWHFVKTTDTTVASTDITVVRDVVFLLENQIPFFILEETHKLITRGADDGAAFVVNKVARHVETLVRCHGYVSTEVTLEWHKNPCHLLHLLYMYFHPTVLNTTGDYFIVRSTSVPPARWRLGHLLCRCFRPTPLNAAREVQLPVSNDSLVNRNATSGSGPPVTTPPTPAGCHATPCHLLHKLYKNFRPTVNGNATSGSRPPVTTPLTPARWRAATHYYVAGVRLVKRKLDGSKARSILDVELTGGTLHVPCLMVDSNTFRMLRNMVELEQRNPRLGSHVTAYCLFMSQIANSGKDVALLVTKGIIVHFLRSEEDVATGLAKLCDGVILNIYDPKLNYLKPKQDALEKLCRDGCRKSMAWLRHNKCNNYLMALAVLGAFIIFVCTVEQAVFAASSYYAKGKH